MNCHYNPPIFYKDYLYFFIAVETLSFFKYHRDVNWETLEERRAKAEFSLMLSLSRKKVDWLSGFKTEKYYLMNRDYIVVRGATWDYEKEEVIGGRRLVEDRSTHGRFPLLYLYQKRYGLDQVGAIERIEDTELYGPTGFPEYEGIATPQDRLNGYSFPTGELYSYDKYGAIGQSVKRVFDEDNRRYALTYTSCWTFVGEPISHEMKMPNPELGQLFYNRKAFKEVKIRTIVILTANLALAEANKDSEKYIWMSWLGDPSNCDFRLLRNHRVYILFEGEEPTEELDKICKQCRAADLINVQVLYSHSNDSSGRMYCFVDDKYFGTISCKDEKEKACKMLTMRCSVYRNRGQRNKEIVKLSQSGCTEQEIADTVGCSISTVKRVRKSRGLTKSRKGRI